MSRDVVIPGVYYALLTGGGFIARKYIFRHSYRSVLDTSGHAIIQTAQNLGVMKSLQGLEETGTSLQKKILRIFHAAVLVTDGIWMYNTAANCHSVADVIAGLACSAVAYAGIESGKIILSKGYDWSKHKLIKYLKKSPQIAGQFHEKDFTPITFNKYSLFLIKPISLINVREISLKSAIMN